MVAAAMGGGADNNQLKGAADEMMAVSMVMVAETAMATETATVTATITTPMSTPAMAHQQQQ